MASPWNLSLRGSRIFPALGALDLPHLHVGQPFRGFALPREPIECCKARRKQAGVDRPFRFSG
jgi:hypothetical protein